MFQFEIYSDKDKKDWLWQLLDMDKRKIAYNAEPFDDKIKCLSEVKVIRRFINTCDIVSVEEKEIRSEIYFITFEEGDGSWAWQIREKGTRKTIAIGERHFDKEKDAIANIQEVRKMTFDAAIIWQDPSDRPPKDNTPGKGIPGS